MLIRLKNGNCVDPRSVFAVIAAECVPPEPKLGTKQIPDRVIVRYAGGTSGSLGSSSSFGGGFHQMDTIIYLDSFEAAESYRDQLFREINQALTLKPSN